MSPQGDVSQAVKSRSFTPTSIERELNFEYMKNKKSNKKTYLVLCPDGKIINEFGITCEYLWSPEEGLEGFIRMISKYSSSISSLVLNQ